MGSDVMNAAVCRSLQHANMSVPCLDGFVDLEGCDNRAWV